MSTDSFSKDGIHLERETLSGVFTIYMDRKENRFNPSLVKDVGQALKVVEEADHPKALIITGEGKFFSNGLDINWMGKFPEKTPSMIEGVWKLLGRILIMDCRTVAAINGHAFGAGLFMALACDYRIMRTKRGFVNFPEVNLGMRLAKGFSELAKAKCTITTLREGVLTAKRYGSTDAIAAGLVDEECPLEELQMSAEIMAKGGLAENLRLANFNPGTFSQIKIELYTDAYRALTMGTAASPSHSRL
ncbi:unnamed protein product [Cylindrotheca closterium]|uniref:Enoyl-CoA hydratase/isomerase family protein n=1 Tax=Cylindrotheca closterium TaxID=2856 RepID=A0AAD2C9Z2_9STRA|nr:unnamed protein product [Cylindrotheca closterium]